MLRTPFSSHSLFYHQPHPPFLAPPKDITSPWQGARRGGPAGGGRLGHAGGGVGQPHGRHHHDRREGRGPHQGGVVGGDGGPPRSQVVVVFVVVVLRLPKHQ